MNNRFDRRMLLERYIDWFNILQNRKLQKNTFSKEERKIFFQINNVLLDIKSHLIYQK